jgi:hypothetical protein
VSVLFIFIESLLSIVFISLIYLHYSKVNRITPFTGPLLNLQQKSSVHFLEKKNISFLSTWEGSDFTFSHFEINFGIFVFRRTLFVYERTVSKFLCTIFPCNGAFCISFIFASVCNNLVTFRKVTCFIIKIKLCARRNIGL